MCLVLFGVGYRLAISLRAPVSYDEVFVMGIGLDEIGDPAGGFIDVPLRRSNAITPLWWWVQAIAPRLSGGLSLAALRVAPLLLGAAALLLAYLVAAPRFGRKCAAVYLLFAATSDVLAFTNARGEYAETLLMLLVLPAAALTGDQRRPWLKTILWALLPLAHLGKGLLLVGTMALAEAVAQWASGQCIGKLKSVLVRLGAALVPSALWVAVCSLLVSGRTLSTDIGEVRGPLATLRAITLDYSGTKSHMVVSAREAMQVWLDPWAWPLTCLSGPLLLVGLLVALTGPRGRRRSVALGLLPWMIAALGLVLGRGMLGARFHLLYLPALWLAASLGLRRFTRVPRVRSVTGRFPAGLAAPVMLLAGGAVLLLALSRGPARWAAFARFEPYAGAEERAAIEAHARGEAPLPGPHGRTLYIDLANYFLTKLDPTDRDRRKAAYYAELETSRVPNDARAWYYLARARRNMGEPPARVLEAARRSQELRPSEQAARLIEELSGT